ncbi:NAD dependent epimerase/dehydratase [Pleurostoma richardsiae]|uniref:NAD dependent epimerase/dehydratase n=1 Tax=Pleurostoma richardsiae TaxID=41990 RepID=A0AA38RBS5_9PEZI|nr:NAD dependent epimerase/dehydratase [Pleurostoma richardsiae]
MALKTVLVTGANGYIGNAVARSFVRAGWVTYGLIRSQGAATQLAVEEIVPVVGSIDDVESHETIKKSLPPTLDAIVSTTEDIMDYIPHYTKTIELLRTLGAASSANGVRPLVIFTSGCKDYGMGPHYDGAAGLAPHTEESELKPPAALAPRTTYAQKIFDHKDVFAPVLVRPINVYGRASSFYQFFFTVAEGVSAARKLLPVPVPANSVCQAMHVDDCGDAYVALASHPDRVEVEGQVFNISARRYETVDEIVKALVAEYHLPGLKYVEPNALAPGENPWPSMLIDFPQWTGSEKIRRVTGWSDHRPLFSEALHVYRIAYEGALTMKHGNIERIRMLGKFLWSSQEK